MNQPDANEDGATAWCSLINYEAMVLVGTVVGIRVHFARTEEQSRGQLEALQLALTPALALELAQHLTEMAAIASQPATPGTQQN